MMVTSCEVNHKEKETKTTVDTKDKYANLNKILIEEFDEAPSEIDETEILDYAKIIHFKSSRYYTHSNRCQKRIKFLQK